MRLTVRSRLRYRLDRDTQIAVRIAVSDAEQHIVEESIDSGDLRLGEASDAYGRLFRASAGAGDLTIDYRAVVENGVNDRLTDAAMVAAWEDLPVDVYPYLLPSRYCPADQFLRFATREFGGHDGGAKVLAILGWIGSHVDYVSGVSDSATTAAETFVDRAGVCRDFTHLAIALIRAGGIPARAVAAYAWKLDPPDFHAVVEVWLAGQWWLLDPTGLAPVEGLVRIAHGRDAADIAFLTTSAAVTFVEQAVSVSV
jgi:transglutaminase-like putative cysteine protease